MTQGPIFIVPGGNEKVLSIGEKLLLMKLFNQQEISNLLENHKDLIQGKRLGLLTNQTSVDSEGRHIVTEKIQAL